MAEAAVVKTPEQKPTDAATPPTDASAEKTAKGKEMAIVAFLLKYLKFVGIALVVWTMGWLGCSYVWVVSGLFVYVLWRMNQDEKKKRRDAFKATLEHEQESVEARMEDLPSWVRNQLLIQLHITYDQYMDVRQNIVGNFETVFETDMRMLLVSGLLSVKYSRHQKLVLAKSPRTKTCHTKIFQFAL